MHNVSSTITDRKIKIALVGCGRIANNHFQAIKAHDNDLELVAVCDTNKTALDEAMQQHSVDGYSKYDELLAYTNADLITICTPSGLHAEQTIKAAQAGKHVITEKPMATRWNDGLRMVKACDEAGIHFFVVKQNRFNDTLQALKKAVTQKRFGRIYMVNINVFWSRPQSYYDQAKWRGCWELDGGAFMNQACHYVDLLEWLIGPVESVQAMAATLARDIEVEDTGVLNVRWRSGTLGSMNVTMLAYKQNFEGSITILGEKGTVRVGGVAANEIQQWEFAQMLPEDEKIKQTNYQTTSVYGYGHPRYYENVIQVLRGQAEPETDGREGLNVLELLIASYISARDGSKVSLPLEY